MTNLLTLAQKPPDNPTSFEVIEQYERYEITLIDHDYAGSTPTIWNTLHRHFKIGGIMAMAVGNPADTVGILSSFKNNPKYIGGGVGAGFKEAVIPHLDETTPIAKAMGAVNIIRRLPSGRLAGDNTDGLGYVKSLEKLFAEQGRDITGAKVLILGAGGSGRAIAFALAQKGVHITILNRTEAKAEELAQAVNDFIGSKVATGGGRLLIPEVLPLQDAVVSVVDDAHSPLDEYSPLGDMALPVTPNSIKQNREQTAELLSQAKPTLIVSDIRIRKEETPMLADARKRKMLVLNGIPMVVNQGVAAFWWVYRDKLEELDVERADVEDVVWRVVEL